MEHCFLLKETCKNDCYLIWTRCPSVILCKLNLRGKIQYSENHSIIKEGSITRGIYRFIALQDLLTKMSNNRLMDSCLSSFSPKLKCSFINYLLVFDYWHWCAINPVGNIHFFDEILRKMNWKLTWRKKWMGDSCRSAAGAAETEASCPGHRSWRTCSRTCQDRAIAVEMNQNEQNLIPHNQGYNSEQFHETVHRQNCCTDINVMELCIFSLNITKLKITLSISFCEESGRSKLNMEFPMPIYIL